VKHNANNTHDCRDLNGRLYLQVSPFSCGNLKWGRKVSTEVCPGNYPKFFFKGKDDSVGPGNAILGKEKKEKLPKIHYRYLYPIAQGIGRGSTFRLHILTSSFRPSVRAMCNSGVLP